MSDQDSARAKLDACSHIFLTKLETGRRLDLRIHVVEAREQEELIQIETGHEQLDAVLGKGHPIITRPGYSAFTILFKNYICFSVRDETYSIPEDDEDYSRRLRTYQKSAFLDFISKGTWASADHPGPFVHYAMVCDNHVIDVACESVPLIGHRILAADEV